MAFVGGNARLWKAQSPQTQVCKRRGLWMAKMAITVNKSPLPQSQMSLEITVPVEDCKKAYDKFVKGLMKQSDLPGFRKGAAPRQVVINYAGKMRIAAGVVEELVEASAKEAMETEGISAVGQTSLDGDVEDLIASFSENAPFVYKLLVDVWPTPEFTEDYSVRWLTVEQDPFDEKLVDDALEEFRKREATYDEVEDGAELQWGDQAVANMEGFFQAEDGSKGEPLPDFAEGEGVEISIEEGKFMAGFVEGLVGAKPGELRSVPVQFSENARQELAGLKAIFDVSIVKVRKRSLPELNDELAISAAGKKDLAELRDELRSRLNFEVDQSNDTALVKAIEDELEKIIKVDLPQTLVEEQTRNKFATMMSEFKSQGMDEEQVKALITQENFEKYAKNARGNVEAMLRKSFAIQKIAEEEGVKIEDEEIDAQLALLRAELKEELDEDSAREKVFSNLQRDAVMKILKTCWFIKKVDKQAEPAEAEVV